MRSPRFRAGSPQRRRDTESIWKQVCVCFLLTAALSAAAVWFCHTRGYILYYGDAAAHVNTARRILDSRTPSYEQFGTVWLPLPHALMLPFVRDDRLWRSGLAGSIPAAACFVLAATFLYATLRRATGSRAAALAGAAVFALNPNLLYLQSTPMTEPVFFACLAAALYFCVQFQARRRIGYALFAGLAMLAATLTRYEGWFLIPFLALFFLLCRAWGAAVLFLCVAALGPLYWLAHNQYFYSDALEFYRGPYSPHAIYARGLAKGYERHPGDHDLATAWRYYRAAMELALGRPLVWVAAAGMAACLIRRATRPLLLLLAPVAFYVLSLHSGGTPLYVPTLNPFSYYNTRYALAALPACAAGVAALAALWPKSFLRAAAAVVLLAVAVGPWLLRPRADAWICWAESDVNSRGRRAWTRQLADFLRQRYRPGDGILTVSGDVLAVYQSAGIPLRETVNDGSPLLYWPAVMRPDLFLRESWVVAVAGDEMTFNLDNPTRYARLATQAASFSGEREPVIQVYRIHR